MVAVTAETAEAVDITAVAAVVAVTAETAAAVLLPAAVAAVTAETAEKEPALGPEEAAAFLQMEEMEVQPQAAATVKHPEAAEAAGTPVILAVLAAAEPAISSIRK